MASLQQYFNSITIQAIQPVAGTSATFEVSGIDNGFWPLYEAHRDAPIQLQWDLQRSGAIDRIVISLVDDIITEDHHLRFTVDGLVVGISNTFTARETTTTWAGYEDSFYFRYVYGTLIIRTSITVTPSQTQEIIINRTNLDQFSVTYSVTSTYDESAVDVIFYDNQNRVVDEDIITITNRSGSITTHTLWPDTQYRVVFTPATQGISQKIGVFATPSPEQIAVSISNITQCGGQINIPSKFLNSPFETTFELRNELDTITYNSFNSSTIDCGLFNETYKLYYKIKHPASTYYEDRIYIEGYTSTFTTLDLPTVAVVQNVQRYTDKAEIVITLAGGSGDMIPGTYHFQTQANNYSSEWNILSTLIAFGELSHLEAGETYDSNLYIRQSYGERIKISNPISFQVATADFQCEITSSTTSRRITVGIDQAPTTKEYAVEFIIDDIYKSPMINLNYMATQNWLCEELFYTHSTHTARVNLYRLSDSSVESVWTDTIQITTSDVIPTLTVDNITHLGATAHAVVGTNLDDYYVKFWAKSAGMQHYISENYIHVTNTLVNEMISSLAINTSYGMGINIYDYEDDGGLVYTTPDAQMVSFQTLAITNFHEVIQKHFGVIVSTDLELLPDGQYSTKVEIYQNQTLIDSSDFLPEPMSYESNALDDDQTYRVVIITKDTRFDQIVLTHTINNYTTPNFVGNLVYNATQHTISAGIANLSNAHYDVNFYLNGSSSAFATTSFDGIASEYFDTRSIFTTAQSNISITAEILVNNRYSRNIALTAATLDNQITANCSSTKNNIGVSIVNINYEKDIIYAIINLYDTTHTTLITTQTATLNSQITSINLINLNYITNYKIDIQLKDTSSSSPYATIQTESTTKMFDYSITIVDDTVSTKNFYVSSEITTGYKFKYSLLSSSQTGTNCSFGTTYQLTGLTYNTRYTLLVQIYPDGYPDNIIDSSYKTFYTASIPETAIQIKVDKYQLHTNNQEISQQDLYYVNYILYIKNNPTAIDQKTNRGYTERVVFDVKNNTTYVVEATIKLRSNNQTVATFLKEAKTANYSFSYLKTVYATKVDVVYENISQFQGTWQLTYVLKQDGAVIRTETPNGLSFSIDNLTELTSYSITYTITNTDVTDNPYTYSDSFTTKEDLSNNFIVNRYGSYSFKVIQYNQSYIDSFSAQLLTKNGDIIWRQIQNYDISSGMVIFTTPKEILTPNASYDLVINAYKNNELKNSKTITDAVKPTISNPIIYTQTSTDRILFNGKNFPNYLRGALLIARSDTGEAYTSHFTNSQTTTGIEFFNLEENTAYNFYAQAYCKPQDISNIVYSTSVDDLVNLINCEATETSIRMLVGAVRSTYTVRFGYRALGQNNYVFSDFYSRDANNQIDYTYTNLQPNTAYELIIEINSNGSQIGYIQANSATVYPGVLDCIKVYPTQAVVQLSELTETSSTQQRELRFYIKPHSQSEYSYLTSHEIISDVQQFTYTNLNISTEYDIKIEIVITSTSTVLRTLTSSFTTPATNMTFITPNQLFYTTRIKASTRTYGKLESIKSGADYISMTITGLMGYHASQSLLLKFYYKQFATPEYTFFESQYVSTNTQTCIFTPLNPQTLYTVKVDICDAGTQSILQTIFDHKSTGYYSSVVKLSKAYERRLDVYLDDANLASDTSFYWAIYKDGNRVYTPEQENLQTIHDGTSSIYSFPDGNYQLSRECEYEIKAIITNNYQPSLITSTLPVDHGEINIQFIQANSVNQFIISLQKLEADVFGNANFTIYNENGETIESFNNVSIRNGTTSPVIFIPYDLSIEYRVLANITLVVDGFTIGYDLQKTFDYKPILGEKWVGDGLLQVHLSRINNPTATTVYFTVIGNSTYTHQVNIGVMAEPFIYVFNVGDDAAAQFTVQAQYQQGSSTINLQSIIDAQQNNISLKVELPTDDIDTSIEDKTQITYWTTGFDSTQRYTVIYHFYLDGELVQLFERENTDYIVSSQESAKRKLYKSNGLISGATYELQAIVNRYDTTLPNPTYVHEKTLTRTVTIPGQPFSISVRESTNTNVFIDLYNLLSDQNYIATCHLYNSTTDIGSITLQINGKYLNDVFLYTDVPYGVYTAEVIIYNSYGTALYTRTTVVNHYTKETIWLNAAGYNDGTNKYIKLYFGNAFPNSNCTILLQDDAGYISQTTVQADQYGSYEGNIAVITPYLNVDVIVTSINGDNLRRGTIRVYVPDNRTISVALWNWNASNGTATAQETQLAHNAITNQGKLSLFSHKVWNDIASKVEEIYKALGMETELKDFSTVYMSIVDRDLTARRFNLLGNKINKLLDRDFGPSDGIPTVESGDRVMGSYFTSMTTLINNFITEHS